MKKRVLVINTGGTIGMRDSANGLIPEVGYLPQILQQLVELKHPELPQYELIEHDPLIDSSNVTLDVWNKIAADILTHYQDFDGFVILHGTDTMAYSSSALSFMLENLAKPVVFTGAQLPLNKIRSDGRDNFVNSLYVASHLGLAEVVLCFHDVVLRGNRAKKISSVNYAAFDSPNFVPLAHLESEVRLEKSLLLPKATAEFAVQKLKSAKIVAIKLFPSMTTDYLASICESGVDAIVLATYGLGNASNQDQQLLDLFDQANRRGVLLVNSTQCPHGRVDMKTYAAARHLVDVGFVSSADMTIEAVIAKLYYLFSVDFPMPEIKRLFQENLRGELTLYNISRPT